MVLLFGSTIFYSFPVVIFSRAYSQHWITSRLNDMSFLSASLCSLSIKSSGILMVLFESAVFLSQT